jgi:hypothetical protein
MNLPKYAKELDRLYVGGGKYSELEKHRKRFINSLKQLDGNPREYLLEKIFILLGRQDYFANAVPLIKSVKEAWDAAVPNLIKVLAGDIKAIFNPRNVKATLTSSIRDWCETLSEHTKQYLFSGNESRILALMLAVTNDESAFVQRLAKAITSLRIEDWNNDTITVFLKDLQKFKTTVDDYNSARQKSATTGVNEYKISFKDERGAEVTKTFERVEYSRKAKMLFDEIISDLNEHGQSITEQEKRQVLMELLQQLCQ